MPFVLRSKWGGRVLDEGYVPVPKRLLRCAGKLFRGKRRLSNLRAMLAIVDYERPTVARAASIEYLAFLAGMSKKRFSESLQDMQQCGWITVKGPSDGVTINYRGFIKAIEAVTKDSSEDTK
ncbi:MAG TPA: hypothetical protein VG722_13280 [Tepidisphaeraceae bacterium]|nr:hypothetical protein [Tepidisphaeraceae bacterium]